MYSAWAEPESMNSAPRSDGNIRKHVFTGHLHQDQVPPVVPRPTRPSTRQRPDSRLWFVGTAGGSPGLGAARTGGGDVGCLRLPDATGRRGAVARLDDATGRN